MKQVASRQSIPSIRAVFFTSNVTLCLFDISLRTMAALFNFSSHSIGRNFSYPSYRPCTHSIPSNYHVQRGGHVWGSSIQSVWSTIFSLHTRALVFI